MEPRTRAHVHHRLGRRGALPCAQPNDASLQNAMTIQHTRPGTVAVAPPGSTLVHGPGAEASPRPRRAAGPGAEMGAASNPCWRADTLGGVQALTLMLDAVQVDALLALAHAGRGHAATPELTPRSAFPQRPELQPLVNELRARLCAGHGAVVVRGLPGLPAADAAWLLWAIGAQLGDAEPQDAAGARLHHVRDLGADVTAADHVRGFQTSGALDFHNDGGEVFALYCVAGGRTGGDSLLVSAAAVYAEIERMRPDLAAVLREPVDFDTRAQQRSGAPRLQRAPIFVCRDERLWVLYKRGYIHLGQRFPEARRLSPAQVAAMDLLDALCRDPRFHLSFRLQPGDLELANNFTLLHARTAFTDGGGAARHLLRLWLTLDDGCDVPDAYAHTREFAGTWQRRRAARGEGGMPVE